MSHFDQDTIKSFYKLWARPYRWLVPLYLLGNEGRLRRKAVNALNLRQGQVVVDVGCGTGRNFPYIIEQIGSEGHLIGLDYTPAMLEAARRMVAQRQWQNVTLIQGDAAQFRLEQRVDAALSTLAMSVIPHYREALQRMVASVHPGGRVVIADARRSERPYARPFNIVADTLGWGAAADLTRRPWETLAGLARSFAFESFFLGFLYVAAGTVGTKCQEMEMAGNEKHAGEPAIARA